MNFAASGDKAVITGLVMPTAVTVATWIKDPPFGNGGPRIFEDVTPRMRFFLGSTGDVILQRLYTTTTQWEVTAANLGAIDWTAWHHIAIAHDGVRTNPPSIYVDGVSYTVTNSLPGSGASLVGATQDMTVGNRPANARNAGHLAWTGMYPVKLTQLEVITLMHVGYRQDATFFFPFEDLTDPALDRSGNGKHADLQGAPTLGTTRPPTVRTFFFTEAIAHDTELPTDATPPAAPTITAVTEPVSGTIRVSFTMPADADAASYTIRWKAGAGQSFSDHTDGNEHTPVTASTPSATVSNKDQTGFTPGSTYTVGVFASDEVPNWSAPDTADITLAAVMSASGTLEVSLDPELTVAVPLAATIELLMTGTASLSGQSQTPPPRPTTGSIRTQYIYVLYAKDGTQIGRLRGLTAQSITYRYRGIDQASFTMPLDGRLADQIEELATSVRVWRKREGIVPNPLFPDFAGVVGPIDEDGDSGLFTVTCFSPLWKLRGRNLRSPVRVNMDQSSIIEALIAHTNILDHTGIYPGDTPNTVVRARDYDQDQNIWQAIEELQFVLGGVDLVPVYVAEDPINGPTALMRLHTVLERGALQPGAALHWRLGKHNVEGGFGRSSNVEPGEYGNSITVVGQGSPDSDLRATNFDAAQISARGLYEVIESRDNVQTFAALDAISQDVLDRRKFPVKAVRATPSPINGPVYGRDFTVGDTLPIAGKRGRLEVNQPMRVHECTLTLSDNGTERAGLLLANEEA